MKKCRGRNWRWKMLLVERRGKEIFVEEKKIFWFNQLRPAVRSQNTCVIFYVREDVQCSNKGIFFFNYYFHGQSTSWSEMLKNQLLFPSTPPKNGDSERQTIKKKCTRFIFKVWSYIFLHPFLCDLWKFESWNVFCLSGFFFLHLCLLLSYLFYKRMKCAH